LAGSSGCAMFVPQALDRAATGQLSYLSDNITRTST
jgi:hypothetical protein